MDHLGEAKELLRDSTQLVLAQVDVRHAVQQPSLVYRLEEGRPGERADDPVRG